LVPHVLACTPGPARALDRRSSPGASTPALGVRSVRALRADISKAIISE
jgi:hypothetical protein